MIPSWVSYLVTWTMMSYLAAATTYDIKDLCQIDPSDHPFFHRHRRQLSQRMYGKSLELKVGDPILVTVGAISGSNLMLPLESKWKSTQPREPPATSINGSSNQVTADNSFSPPKANLLRLFKGNHNANTGHGIDCRFTIKSPKAGSNISIFVEWWNMEENCSNFIQISHGPDLFIIRMTKVGSKIVSNTIYFPLHVRVAICRRATSNSGLFVLASANGDGFGDYTTSSLVAFLTPCGVLLLLLTTFFLGCCCCCSKDGCRKRRQNALDSASCSSSSSTSSILTPVVGTPTEASTRHHPSSVGGRPPTYDELFPSTDVEAVKGKETPPPTYDKLRLGTGQHPVT